LKNDNKKKIKIELINNMRVITVKFGTRTLLETTNNNETIDPKLIDAPIMHALALIRCLSSGGLFNFSISVDFD
jgi:hypothetical protein